MSILFSHFDRIYVINLAFRADRRREINAQLRRVDRSLEHEQVVLFDAVRPDDAGDFPSIGGKGCFMSHLNVLKDMQTKGYKRILIVEDDADFTKHFLSPHPDINQAVQEQDWGLFYFGYSLADTCKVTGDQPVGKVAPTDNLGLTHGMAVDHSIVDDIIPYFEAMAARPGGDPKGGPMQIDGAYSWFRKDHPTVLTLATRNQLMIQRPSATDIHPPTWREHIPLINLLRRGKSQLKRFKSRSTEN